MALTLPDYVANKVKADMVQANIHTGEASWVLSNIDLLAPGTYDIIPAFTGKTFIPHISSCLLHIENAVGTGILAPVFSLGTNSSTYDNLSISTSINVNSLAISKIFPIVFPTVPNSVAMDSALKLKINTYATGFTTLIGKIIIKGIIA